jgi:tetratricopeptide (TPR) repeat protein
MSDPLRTDDSRAPETAPGPEREAKIEELLLAGLDHYFATQYQQAINIWTRALFLDRSHPRARAYIERARSALAERQRESEELLQRGIAAFQDGEGAEARRLLQAALDSGAPPDEALAILDRLNRLDPAAKRRPVRPVRQVRLAADPRSTATPDEPRGATGPSRAGILAGALVLAVLAAGISIVPGWSRFNWRSLGLTRDPSGSALAPPTLDTTLPLPRRAEIALARARSLAAGGHLRDALTVLDAVRSTDPQKADADRLRTDIQRQLIALPQP